MSSQTTHADDGTVINNGIHTPETHVTTVGAYSLCLQLVVSDHSEFNRCQVSLTHGVTFQTPLVFFIFHTCSFNQEHFLLEPCQSCHGKGANYGVRDSLYWSKVSLTGMKNTQNHLLLALVKFFVQRLIQRKKKTQHKNERMHLVPV